jgi:alanyl-tRNA synthetase
MTERLYYHDPTVLEFEGRITETGQQDKVWYTVLDRSAFYPTSGGQLHDVGVLNGHRVIDVIEEPDGETSVVKHITADKVGDVGQNVTGIVDAGRRQDNRQKHTAQHIISHVFSSLAKLATVSVHLGIDYGAVELETGRVEDPLLERAERRANEIVTECHPVDILFATRDEVARMPLRRRPPDREKLRIIRIGNLDWSACGGTHCSNTGEVGVIKLIGVDTMRGHALIKFLAGRQALEDYARCWRISTDLATSLTCSVDDLPDRIAGLARETEEYRHQLRQAEKELLTIRAERLAAASGDIAGIPAAVVVDRHLDPKKATQLARYIADHNRGVAVVLVGDRISVAVGEGGRVGAGRLVRRLCELAGGRGGGNDVQAQAGNVAIESEESLQRLLMKVLNEA